MLNDGLGELCVVCLACTAAMHFFCCCVFLPSLLAFGWCVLCAMSPVRPIFGVLKLVAARVLRAVSPVRPSSGALSSMAPMVLCCLANYMHRRHHNFIYLVLEQIDDKNFDGWDGDL